MCCLGRFRSVQNRPQIDLDLSHHDQRRVVSLLWSLAEKERMENLVDIVTWQKKTNFRRPCCFGHSLKMDVSLQVFWKSKDVLRYVFVKFYITSILIASARYRSSSLAFQMVPAVPGLSFRGESGAEHRRVDSTRVLGKRGECPQLWTDQGTQLGQS